MRKNKNNIFIIYSFLGSDFEQNVHSATIGFGTYSKTFKLSDGTIVNCFILDTGGAEEFHSLTASYYRKADAILLLYDITKKYTFDEIKDYYAKEIRERCNINIPVVLIGNKLDKESEREVSRKEAIELALKEKYRFKETSCKTNENVDSAFETLIELWSIEERKKKLIGERSNSDEFRKNKKRDIVIKSSISATITFGEKKNKGNDNFFVIESSTKKTSKKKCEC
jgi:small GTP-binding protein